MNPSKWVGRLQKFRETDLCEGCRMLVEGPRARFNFEVWRVRFDFCNASRRFVKDLTVRLYIGNSTANRVGGLQKFGETIFTSVNRV